MKEKLSNKGGAPKQHWEMPYSMSKYAKSKNPMHAFDPRCANERPKLYNKVNETDH